MSTSEQTLEQKLDELAANIKAGCALCSDFNPKDDILNFMKENAPDLLVTVNDDGDPDVYVNNHELLGRVVMFNPEFSDTPNYDYTPKTVKGDADAWHTYLSLSPSLTGFCERFILNNS
jgi:hypothetical protein